MSPQNPSSRDRVTTSASKPSGSRRRSGGERRARGSLTRAEIAEVALKLLDEHGLEVVTVRQIAAELGASAMSLYVHTRNKDEIIQAAVDLVLSSIPHVNKAIDAPTAVTEFFESFHDEMLRHPSVAQTIASTAVLGPATFSSFNSLFGVLADAGLDEQERLTATTALMSYTLGFTLFSIARARADADTTEWRRAGLQGVDPTEYPALYHMRNHLLANTYAVQFTDGLTRLVHAYLPTTRK